PAPAWSSSRRSGRATCSSGQTTRSPPWTRWSPATRSSPGTRSRPSGPMRIPRLFHQIWLGPSPLPDEYRRYQQTWLDHHQGWELRLWTEEGLPAGLRRPELLWREGGVYVDTDFECLRSIEPLIEDAELFITLAKPDRVNNALMGS